MLTVASFAPTRVKCPAEPPEVQDTIRVTKTVQFVLAQVINTPKPVTIATIMSAVPGGTTYWNKVRINSLRIWSETQLGASTANPVGTAPVLRVVAATESGWQLPNVSWTDTGTPGQRRSGIAYLPSMFTRGQWFGTASTTNICDVSNANGTPNPNLHAADITIQVNLELMSPSLS